MFVKPCLSIFLTFTTNYPIITSIRLLESKDILIKLFQQVTNLLSFLIYVKK